MANLREFLNAHECDEELTNVLSQEIDVLLKKQPKFNLAIAGGGTPKNLYHKLSQVNLPWDKVQVTLTDERWVNIDNMDSNEKMVREVFFKNKALKASFIPLKNSISNAQEAVELCDKNLKQHMVKLDRVILGMGEDGHFASIFPNTVNLEALLGLNQTHYCLAVLPKEKSDRMSLTLAYLLSAEKIYLRVSGLAKKKILLGILNGAALKDPYPVTALINQQLCPIEIYWSP